MSSSPRTESYSTLAEKNQTETALLLHHKLNELIVCKIHQSRCARGNWGPHTVNSSITILISLPNHLINLIICQLLTNGCHDMTELSGGDETIIVTIEDLVLQYQYRTHLPKINDSCEP
jgi:hypothetical protein